MLKGMRTALRQKNNFQVRENTHRTQIKKTTNSSFSKTRACSTTKPKTIKLPPNKKIGLIGVKYDSASTFLRGCRDAPSHIRAAFECDSSNSYTELYKDLHGIDEPESPFEFFGDLDMNGAPNQEIYVLMYNVIKRVLDNKLRPLALGGDRSITYPILKSLKHFGPELTLLHFNAHPTILHDEPLGNKILEEKLVKEVREIGVRTATSGQKAIAAQHNVKSLEMKDWNSDSINSDFFKIEGPVYITFSMDVLDPGFAPGVSHWEPGGLSSREAINILHKLAENQVKVVGADIVEYNPARDLFSGGHPVGITAKVAAKIMKEISSLLLTDL